MINLKKWLVCGLIIAASFFAFGSTVHAGTYGELIGDHVRVRSTPALYSDSNILFQVNMGEQIEILYTLDYFYRVNVRDYTDVYIFREFVRNTYTPVAEVQQEVLEEAEVTYEEIVNDDAIYDDEEAVEAFSFFDPETWLYGGLLPAELTDISDFMPDTSLADDIVAHAKTYLGVPYRFGGTNRHGFDCSGFVMVVMRNFDINLNRTSRDMAANNGVRVERNALQAGDLVFFATGGGGRVSHVGIYIGNDRFIHSATRGGVMVSGMGETYWRTRFVRANRVL